ncbi:exocyst complex component Sec6 [Gigaspora margarita]|uniref:Exocyst complex component Sec6 n=1 Tax=Gigaspora margarita TaxID=4874 RepID=A0A8H4A047_GIGMA|nr:exocyst complex component Sec6 [Gigaspora margarita]
MESIVSTEDEKKDVNKKAHKTNITKLLKSYDLFKVKINVKFRFEKDTLVKKGSNIRAYLGLGRFSHSGKHGKQKDSEKESMQKIIHSTSNQQQPTINHFPKINKVPQINHNNVGTQEIQLQVQEMHQFINRLWHSLKLHRQNSSSSADNLLLIHSQLSALEASRDNTMHEAKFASRDVISVLQLYFKPLDDLLQDFTCYLWELTRNIFTLASNSHAKTVIKSLARIIWLEEEMDVQMNETRITKSYKNNFFSILNNTILERFELFLSKVKDAPLTLLDKLDFIYNDLNLVKDEIEPLFPSHYNIRLFFVQEYHDQVYIWLNDVMQTDLTLDAGTIFDLIRWVRQYYLKIVSDMNISQDLLEPELLDGREHELIDYLLSIMRNKFQEWKNNLIGSDIKEFVERPYELDANKVTGLSGTPVLLSMINQQIDLAIMSTHEKILADVVKECCTVMIDIQQTWMIVLESEVRLYIEEKGEPRLLEYIVALANDEYLCADHVDEKLKTKLEPLFKSKEYWDSVNVELCHVRDGFLDVVTNAISTASCIVFNDLKKPFREMHTSQWYKADPISVITVTIEDYLNHIKSCLNSHLFAMMIDTMIQKFVIAYIESMRNKNAKYRTPQCLDHMRKDIRVAENFFMQYIKHDEINRQFDPIHKLHNFLNTSREVVHIDYYALKTSYGDVSRKFLKNILSKRYDLITSRNINKITKSKELEYGKYTGEPTIFSMIKVNDEDASGEQLDRFKGEVQQLSNGFKDGFKDLYYKCKTKLHRPESYQFY